jgi:processive 1,2-diacylglycerol beta-glucosyltransferase
LWASIYYATERNLNPAIVIGPFLRSGFARAVGQQSPDLVISVLPAINGVLSDEAHKRGARMEVVLTDWHSIHPYWVAHGVDHYTVPTDSARDECIRFGAPAEAIDVIGIPVRREFTSNPRVRTRAETLHELGLEPRRFSVLVMVGAEGSPRAVESIAQLAKAALDVQLVVVCGRNDELRRRLETLPTRMAIRALGFIDNVAALMRATDLLVTKAGGVTLAEALCCEIPVVVYDVLPGQEAGNLAYLLRRGAVTYAPRPAALVSLVGNLMQDQRRRAELSRCGAEVAPRDAARRYAERVLTRVRYA